jgi:hypothetical protein
MNIRILIVSMGVLAAVMSLSSKPAFATWDSLFGGPCAAGEDEGTGDCDGLITGTLKCAPEVVSGNAKAATRTLNLLAIDPEFNSLGTTTKFTKILNEISKRDAGIQVKAYLSLAGVNPSKPADVSRFVGARKSQMGPYLKAIKENAGISEEQAAQVATKLGATLRGE